MRVMFLIIAFFINQKMHADMIEDMAVMMGAQVGASAANQAVSSEFSDMQQALSNDQANITKAMNDFSTAVQAAQKRFEQCF